LIASFSVSGRVPVAGRCAPPRPKIRDGNQRSGAEKSVAGKLCFSQGLRLKQIISIAIVECQRDGAAGQVPFSRAWLNSGTEVSPAFQHRELFVEIVWLITDSTDHGTTATRWYQDYHLSAGRRRQRRKVGQT
jgi:hypothetical protein